MRDTLETTEFGKFLIRNRACTSALPWASGMRTYEEGYDLCPHPNWLLWAMRIARVHDRMALRRWGCWCARKVAHHVSDPVCLGALDVAERSLDGRATEEEMALAAKAAMERATGGAWPNAVTAWAARAAAEAAGKQPSTAAKAALQTWCLEFPTEEVWKSSLQIQVDKLREFLGAETRIAVLANLRKLDQQGSERSWHRKRTE